MLFACQSKKHRTLRVVGVKPASTVWTVIVDEARRGHNDPVTALLDPLHMPYVAPGYPKPQTANVVSFRRQWLRAPGQNRQGKWS